MKKLIKNYKGIYVRPNDFDEKDDLRPSAILDYFQFMATDHAEDINLGYLEMKNAGLAWILAKQKYVIEGNIKMSEMFSATTYPLPAHKIEYDRVYEIKNDNIYIKGLSRWCVADINTHMLSRKGATYNGECIDDDKGIEFDKELVRLNDLSSFEKTSSYIVKYSDLDHYHHMNNTKYGDVLISAIDKNYHIKELEIIYVHECVENDVIESYVKKEEDTIYIFGKIENTDRIVFKSKIKIEL